MQLLIAGCCTLTAALRRICLFDELGLMRRRGSGTEDERLQRDHAAGAGHPARPSVSVGQRRVRPLYRPLSSTSGATSRPSTRRISVLSLISRLPRSILEIWTTASAVLADSSSWVQPRSLRASRTFSPNF